MPGIRWAATLMPPALICVVAYVTYVVVVTLCFNLLISPPASGKEEARIPGGVVILVAFFIFVILMATSFFRLLYHAILDPGFVGGGGDVKESADGDGGGGVWQQEKPWQTPRLVRSGPSLSSFYDQYFFECDAEGKPLWCAQCSMWKPDRARHSKAFGHCIRKLDHYCPWVGGLVGERNFKFFIQFSTYAACFSLLSLAVTGTFLGRGTVYKDPLSIHLGIVAGLGSFFLCLAGGTGLSGWLLAAMNLTTIDNIRQKSKVWLIAVRASAKDRPQGDGIRFVTAPQDPERTFAILESEPGVNPYDLGPMENLRQVLGNRWWDWLLPIAHSPITNSEPRVEATSTVWPCVEKMKENAGLTSLTPETRKAYEDPRKRQMRFPHMLAAAGAPLKTCK